jgi:hypothetical protein
MSYEDDMMEEFCGFENTEEDFEADQDEKIRVAEERLDNAELEGGQL